MTLDYGVHLAVAVVKGLVIGFVVVPANRNEKRVLPQLFIRLIMAGFRIKTLIADPQYSSNSIRILCSLCKITAIIPYPRNHFRQVKGLLRVEGFSEPTARKDRLRCIMNEARMSEATLGSKAPTA